MLKLRAARNFFLFSLAAFLIVISAGGWRAFSTPEPALQSSSTSMQAPRTDTYAPTPQALRREPRPHQFRHSI